MGRLLDSSTVTQERLDRLVFTEQSKSQTNYAEDDKDSSQLNISQGERSARVYDWLSPLAGEFERKQQEMYNTAERQDGMARWLFNTAEFKRWLSGTGQMLWCTGMHKS